MPDARVLPHNLDAERSVIGAVLLRNEVLADVEFLEARDFYRQAHAHAFACAQALWKDGKPIDLLTLADALSSAGQLESSGGPAYLAKLVDGVPRSINALHYAHIVRSKRTLRDLVQFGERVVADVQDVDAEAGEILEAAERALRGVVRDEQDEGFVDGPALARIAYDAIERNSRAEGGITGVATGFPRLDRMTAGLRPGNLVLLAARPSMGKSAMASQIVYHVGVHLARPVAFFALEMHREEISLRMACAAGDIDHARADRGWLNTTEHASLHRVLGEMEKSRIYLDDGTLVRVENIRRKCRWLQAQHGDLGLIVVDYLQLMRAPSGTRTSDNVTQIIGAISRELKAMAKELACPVLALSQLNRACESRPDKRPMPSDLRESGALEQDADLLMFLYRDEVYNKGPEHDNVGQAELIIAKQRNGPLGTVKLEWQGEHVRFNSLAGAA